MVPRSLCTRTKIRIPRHLWSRRTRRTNELVGTEPLSLRAGPLINDEKNEGSVTEQQPMPTNTVICIRGAIVESSHCRQVQGSLGLLQRYHRRKNLC